MKYLKRLAICMGTVCLCLLPVGTAEARNRKGDRFIKQAQKYEAAKDWDSALTAYDRALATEPTDAGYLMESQRAHSRASQQRIAEGKELQKAQRLDLALVQFQKAFLADPGSQIALQEIRATTAMLRERARVPSGTPVYTPAERARQEVERRINALEGPPTLRPLTSQISSLKLNNQPARVLYESVCKFAGINVLFDPSGIESPNAGGKSMNLDLNNVTAEEALNYVALITHTFWKPISANAIFVTQEGEQKRQEYQDEVVKVFYIQNASSPNEFTEIFNGIRTGAKLTQGIFQVASQGAIIARGTPDTIALVEKLVRDLDKPKAEVVLDIIVMEVNKGRSNTIGAAILGQGGMSVPFTFTPRNPTNSTSGSSTSSTTTTTTTDTSTTASSTTLARVGHLSSADYSVSLPSTIVQALLSDSSSRVLQRPQLRVTDGGKASLKIGLKVPYVSGSLNSAVATPGSIPYATTQFTSVETGTLIDLEPRVNGLEDITMHIKVELSNVVRDIAIAGITEPEIGQQIDEAVIRMRDGEVSILGGLSDREKSDVLSGVPGFTSIPGLNYLFGTRAKNDTDNEVLIALMPHIVRAPDYGDISNQGVFAGTDRVPRVSRRSVAQNVSGSEAGAPASSVPPAATPVPNVPQTAPPVSPSTVGPAVTPGAARPAPQAPPNTPPMIVGPVQPQPAPQQPQ